MKTTNAYAKFWGHKQRALWYVVLFSGVFNCNCNSLVFIYSFFNFYSLYFYYCKAPRAFRICYTIKKLYYHYHYYHNYYYYYYYYYYCILTSTNSYDDYINLQLTDRSPLMKTSKRLLKFTALTSTRLFSLYVSWFFTLIKTMIVDLWYLIRPVSKLSFLH